jgi:hypothetical protein
MGNKHLCLRCEKHVTIWCLNWTPRISGPLPYMVQVKRLCCMCTTGNWMVGIFHFAHQSSEPCKVEKSSFSSNKWKCHIKPWVNMCVQRYFKIKGVNYLFSLTPLVHFYLYYYNINLDCLSIGSELDFQQDSFEPRNWCIRDMQMRIQRCMKDNPGLNRWCTRMIDDWP